MARFLVALVSGLIFGLGLTVSQMINPARVRGFLDVFGDWDPLLAFVMLGALGVTAIGYGLARGRATPILAPGFQLPAHREIDARLAAGAVLFGIGWGLVGLCPGPAIAILLIGGPSVLIFLVAMVVGMIAFEGLGRPDPGHAGPI